MRDLQRLERLSSTVALGMWADDVVLALGRAAPMGEPLAADERVLSEAAQVLKDTMARTTEPLAAASSTRALAAETETTLNVVAALARERSAPDDQNLASEHELLSSLIEVLTSTAAGDSTQVSDGQIETTLAFFGTVGALQLVESNAVLAPRKDALVWTEAKTMLSSY